VCNCEERPPRCHLLYDGESVIIRTVCFIFRKTRAVNQTGESEGVRSRLYRDAPIPQSSVS
jgi:hypothetical protein